MQRVKRNDTVKIISGKDAGKAGRVIRVYPKAGKVLVEGVNVATKHSRVTTSRRGAREGGITHVERPLQASNVMPVCPSCDLPTRVGSKVVDGQRHRHCRKCDAEF
jgi:large subunit ribosomal protein L24